MLCNSNESRQNHDLQKMKGKAFIDIVDSAEEHIKYTREGATHAAVSRQPKAVGTHKGREADDGKGSDGEGTTEAGLKT